MSRNQNREPVPPSNPQATAGWQGGPPRVVAKERMEPRADRPLRLVWTVNVLIFVFGLALSGAVMGFSWLNKGNVGEVAGWMALVSGSLGWLLIQCGGLLVLVLAVLAMVRGAVLRGLLACGGYCLAVWLAVIMFTGAMSWHIQNRDERAKQGKAEGIEKPEESGAGPAVKVEPKTNQPAPATLPPEPERVLSLTNTKGVTITARVLSVDEFGKVKLIKDGREFVIEIGTLNKASQEKIWSWQTEK